MELGRRPSSRIVLAQSGYDLIVPSTWMGKGSMQKDDWASMPTAELWALYDGVTAVLSRRLAAEKAKLEERLRRIEGAAGTARSDETVRRPYPAVLPKYQNPKYPSETWSGRGKQPRWLKAQLRAGKKLDDLLIDRPSRRRRTG